MNKLFGYILMTPLISVFLLAWLNSAATVKLTEAGIANGFICIEAFLFGLGILLSKEKP